MSEKRFDFGVDIPTKITKYTKRFTDLEGFLDEDYDGEHHMLWDNQDECWICLDDVLCLMEKEYVNIKEANDNCRNDYRELFSDYVTLEEENEQLKKSEKINMEYAEQIVEENHKLRIAKNDLRIENEQLRKSVLYWEKKFEEGTETFIIENDDIQPFKFNSNQAQPYTIKNVSPNGVVRLGNGHKAQWRMKDVREISQQLPPFEDFNREIFHEIRNKLGAKFDKDVLGRIIYNIYIGTFGEYI